ncbi:hypothetical protein TeGR_g12886 [Tetraparma gracilis]|uniref:Uncharacterized protein n=1 Tax=Tetraparma gracilis TaxID=2962635 RepID=A0ABQ6MYI1_9STRA|nr:hypothetical protein TeGR_g12886 [Tetraparma gracilis]
MLFFNRNTTAVVFRPDNVFVDVVFVSGCFSCLLAAFASYQHAFYSMEGSISVLWFGVTVASLLCMRWNVRTAMRTRNEAVELMIKLEGGGKGGGGEVKAEKKGRGKKDKAV